MIMMGGMLISISGVNSMEYGEIMTVNITLDKNYKVGATGELQNAAEIGWGYDKEGTPLKDIAGNIRTWKFAAKNVHDFVWAADPDYKHITRKTTNGPLLHFIYKNHTE